jgi:hypothetical protein
MLLDGELSLLLSWKHKYNLFFQMFVILLLYSAHNPKSIGHVAWENYPTLRAFMEMCVTNQFAFPPPTIATGEQADILKVR